MRKFCLIAAFLLVMPVALNAWPPIDDFKPGFGAVQGKVINDEGKPVENAQVSLAPRNGERLTGSGQRATSDVNGEFVLSEVPRGPRVVIATKPGAGYPDMIWKAFTSGINSFSEITVEEGKVTQNVTVVLKRGGTIIGTVVDSSSGQIIPGAWLRIERADDPTLYITTRADIHGKFQFDLPVKPFNVSVSEDGYNLWTNGTTAPNPKGQPMAVSSGAKLDIVVKLERTSKEEGANRKPTN